MCSVTSWPAGLPFVWPGSSSGLAGLLSALNYQLPNWKWQDSAAAGVSQTRAHVGKTAMTTGPPTTTTPKYWLIQLEGPARFLELLWLLTDSLVTNWTASPSAAQKGKRRLTLCLCGGGVESENLWPHYLRRLCHKENFTSCNLTPECYGAENTTLKSSLSTENMKSPDPAYLASCL